MAALSAKQIKALAKPEFAANPDKVTADAPTRSSAHSLGTAAPHPRHPAHAHPLPF